MHGLLSLVAIVSQTSCQLANVYCNAAAPRHAGSLLLLACCVGCSYHICRRRFSYTHPPGRGGPQYDKLE